MYFLFLYLIKMKMSTNIFPVWIVPDTPTFTTFAKVGKLVYQVQFYKKKKVSKAVTEKKRTEHLLSDKGLNICAVT